MLRYARYIFYSITALVLLISVPPASAEDRQVGRVVALRGEVTAVGPDQIVRALSLKSPVFLMDTIKTQRGRVQLMFEDHTLITLGRDAQMRIKEYVYEEGKKSSAMTTEVKEGSFRVMGGAITRDAPENFKTRTPSANIGIRGSMYAGIVEADRLTVVFQGGKGISVANAAGRVEISRPGFGTTVTGYSQSPDKPEKFDEEQLSNIEQGFETGDDEGRDSGEGRSGNSEQAPGDTGSRGEGDDTAKNKSFDNETSETVGETIVEDTQDANKEEASSQSNEEEPLSETERKIVSFLSDLGFAGSKSDTLRSSGVSIYKGQMEVEEDEGLDLEPVHFVLNWDNRRFIGRDDSFEEGDTGLAFGRMTSSGELVDVHVIGGGYYKEEEVSTLTGSETFGHLYGSNQGGLGLSIEGYDINVRDQSQTYAWANTLSAVKHADAASPGTGTETWKGFYFGVAEDMAAPDDNRRVFVNSNRDSLRFFVDKAHGTVRGSMTGYDYNNSLFDISKIEIGGGAQNSVYVSNKDLAMILDGNDSIQNPGGSSYSDLKKYGNYMISCGKNLMSAYSTWGYWEAAYSEPGTGRDYHIHVPGAMWVAGEPTAQSVVQDKIDNQYKATYNGRAEGVRLDSYQSQTRLTNGKTNLTVDFGALAVSGTIEFDQQTFIVGRPDHVTSSGFSAKVTNALSSQLMGTFYGPEANGIGGNFSAEMSQGDRYHGIFAGDR